MSTIQEIATMIEKSKRRFLCIKFRACGLSFSEGIVLLVIGYSRYSNQETISSLSGIDKYQTAKVLAAMEERGYICLLYTSLCGNKQRKYNQDYSGSK